MFLESHLLKCTGIDVIRFKLITFRWASEILFLAVSFILQLRSSLIKCYEKEQNIKRVASVLVANMEPSLNLHHVGSCEMLHFVTSYMNLYKNRYQTL